MVLETRVGARDGLVAGVGRGASGEGRSLGETLEGVCHVRGYPGQGQCVSLNPEAGMILTSRGAKLRVLMT